MTLCGHSIVFALFTRNIIVLRRAKRIGDFNNVILLASSLHSQWNYFIRVVLRNITSIIYDQSMNKQRLRMIGYRSHSPVSVDPAY
jgi:hypothetical protein